MKNIPKNQNETQQFAETNSKGEKLRGYDATKFFLENKLVPIYGEEFKANTHEELVEMGLVKSRQYTA